MNKKKDEEYAYGHIINALASGLYPNKFHVIREYVQNSFDALCAYQKKENKKVEKLEIKIIQKKPSIIIWDNGIGMDYIAIQKYKKIGFSEKNSNEHAGFRGIGKLSGISVAKKLIVESTMAGSDVKNILTFESEQMINEINNVKKQGGHLTVDEVMKKFTSIRTEKASKDEHYTIVELFEVKKDSQILYDEPKLINYLSKNVPVDLSPAFVYRSDVVEGIEKFVQDYNVANIKVNSNLVYKEFPDNVRSNKQIVVWDANKNNVLAYCWYCENKIKGQIKPMENAGLVYRYKNFAIGDSDLVKKTLWKTSPHLASYFIGEIYINDLNVLPTSQRDDFEHNDARDEFYKQAVIISKELNKFARESSDLRKTKEKVESGFLLVKDVENDVRKGASYLVELEPQKVAQIVNTVNEIKKRKKILKETSRDTRTKAKQIVSKGENILTRLKKSRKTTKKSTFFDHIRNYNGEDVYRIIIQILKSEFQNEGERLELIIKKIHAKLSGK